MELRQVLRIHSSKNNQNRHTYNSTLSYGGRDSSVGVVTGYRLDVPGIESRWGARFFVHVQTGPGVHPPSCTVHTGSFPGVKWPGFGGDYPPCSNADVRKV
jgi:hypothetical protein